MGIRDQTTRLVNKTGQLISFAVDRGSCPLRDLPAGKSSSVSLSLILRCCRERGSADWPIRVRINGRSTGMRLHPRHHILKMTRIVFRYKWGPDGTCVPVAEGVAENFVDRVFGCCCCCINWEKRIYVEIAEADSLWRSIRSSQDLKGVRPTVRNANSLSLRVSDTVETPLIDNIPQLSSFILRSASWRKIIVNAFPNQKTRMIRLWRRGRNWNAAVESRRRLYRMLSLRRRDEFNRFLLFVCAFVLVASLHLLRMRLSLRSENSL